MSTLGDFAKRLKTKLIDHLDADKAQAGFQWRTPQQRQLSQQRLSGGAGKAAMDFGRNYAQSYAANAQQMGRGVGGAIRAPFDLYFNKKSAQIDNRVSDMLRRQQQAAMQSGNVALARDKANKIARLQQGIASRQVGMGQQMNKDRVDAFLGTIGTGLQLYGGNNMGVKSFVGNTAVTGGLGYGLTRAFGGTNDEAIAAAGSGAGRALEYKGINKLSDKYFTNPILRNLNKIGISPGNMPVRIGFGAGVNALANMGEDEVLTRVDEGRAPTNTERAVSGGIGAILGGGSQAIQTKQYLKQVAKQQEALAQLANKSRKEAQSSAAINKSIRDYMANFNEPVSKMKRKIGVQAVAVIDRMKQEIDRTGRLNQADAADVRQYWKSYSSSPKLAYHMTTEELVEDLWRHAQSTRSQSGFVGSIDGNVKLSQADTSKNIQATPKTTQLPQIGSDLPGSRPMTQQEQMQQAVEGVIDLFPQPTKGVEATTQSIPVRQAQAPAISAPPRRLVQPQIQTQSMGTQPKIRVAPSQPINTLATGSRTTSSRGSITGNPIKDDVTGVNPSGIVTRLREAVQDNWIRVKNLQRQKGVKVTDEANPYLAEELYHGRVGARMEEIKDTVVQLDREVLDVSKRLNIPDTTIKSDVNRYLQALHTAERNKLHGDGAAGMTNAEAKQVLSELSGSKEVQQIAQKVKDLNNQTLDILLDSQVIDKETFTTLRKVYKNHVPLNRIMDESDDIAQVLVGKGFNVKSSGVKKAVGSQREVADILTNVVTNLESALVRAEKNRVNLATLKFARNNKQLGVFKEIKPKAIGQTFDGKIIKQEVKDPLVLTIRENGKPVYLRIKDQGLATALQGIGNEKIPSMFKFIQSFTGFYSGLHTRFNPEFAASNIVRDTQEMAVFMAAQKDIGFSGAGKAVSKIGGGARDVIDSIRGIDSEGARLYRQMKLDGGTTGGMALSTRKQVELDLAKIEQLNRSNPRKAASAILEGIDNWNTIFEDGTRLSVYKQALANGVSRKQAASMAKNSTVNFNKKGTAGPIINSLYMFSNASIQGSAKMITAMKNPKVAAAVTISVAAPVFAVNAWNDQVDEDWRDKVPEWDRTSNLVVMLPSSDGGAKYFTIPVGYGIKPIKVAADTAYDLSTGHSNNIADGAVQIATAAFDSYNPAGGTDLASTISPTITDTPLDIVRNKSWTGSTIRPDWLKGLPGSEQKYANTDQTLTGKIAVKTADTLSDVSRGAIEISPNDLLYAYNAYIGGVGKFGSRVVDTVSAIAKGDPLVAKEIPFTNRFFKTQSEEQVQGAMSRKTQDEFYNSLKGYETGSEQQKEAIRNYLRQQGSDEERKGTLFKLRDRGFDTKGISPLGSKLGAGNTPLSSEKVSFQATDDMPQNILDKVALAAEGLTKDPGNTIKAIFTQEELRKIEGNAVILKRQDFLNKSKDPNLERDHIIPLGLGGDNSEANLVYVSKEYHQQKTKLDQKLIRQLQAGEITRQEAQEQVKAWVEANPTEHFVVETNEVIGEADKTTEPTGKLELTGNTEVDKKLISEHNSSINKQIKEVYEAFKDGSITAEEAEQQIIKLQATLHKKTKKAKKLKLSAPPKIKPSSLKLTTAKPFKMPKTGLTVRAAAKLPTQGKKLNIKGTGNLVSQSLKVKAKKPTFEKITVRG